MRLTYIFFSFLFIFNIRSQAENLSNPVIDRAHFFSAADQKILAQDLSLLRQQKNIYMALLVLDSLHGQTIESVAEAEFRRYELGVKGIDNGLLLVLALKERKMRFEVGYGLEGDLPDAVTKRLLDDVLRPYLRENKATEGIRQVIQLLNSGSYEILSSPPARIKTANPWAISLTVFGLGLFFLLFLVLFKISADDSETVRIEKMLGDFRPSDWPRHQRKEKIYKRLRPIILWTFITTWVIAVSLPWLPIQEVIVIMGLIFIFVFGFVCVGSMKFFDARYSWIQLYQEVPGSLKEVVKKELLAKGYKYSKEKDSFTRPPPPSSTGNGSSSSRSSSSSSSYSGGGRSGGGGSSSSW